MFDTAAVQGSSNPIWSPPAQAPTALPSAADRAPVADGVARMLRAVPDTGPSSPIAPGERELVASEDSVTAGGVRDAYGMELYREADGTYTLELDMKIAFDFTKGPDGQTWTPQEKQAFIEDYKGAIEQTWSGHVTSSDTGQRVTLDVNLDVVEGTQDAVDGENWSIEVVKIDAGGFNQSYVVPSQNTGRFDSEDVNPVDKGASDPQVGAAHEFGHMIGLPDEYNGNGGPDAQNDTDSVMHTGMDVRDRHLDIVENWVNANN